MNQVMVVGLDDQFIEDVVIALLTRNDCTVSHVTTYDPQRVNLKIGESVQQIIDAQSLIYPEKIHKLTNTNVTLSEKLLIQYSKIENEFLAISDRFAFHPISVRERKRLYITLLRYWLNFLSENHLDAIFFESTPHMGWDNILYDVAKKNSINTYILMRTLLQDRVLLIEDYECIKKVPSNWESDLSNDQLKKLINSTLYSLLSKESAWMQYSKEINNRTTLNRAQRNKSFHSIIQKLKSGFKNHSLIQSGLKKIDLLISKKPVSALFYNGQYFSRLGLYIRRIVTDNKIAVLRKYYKSLCDSIRFDKPYLYFPLNFQPERSTMPEGGVFENQILAVQIIAKALPSHYTIYVKEHPRQFDTKRLSLAKRHFRSKEEYRELSKINNVILIDTNESADKLVENSFAVATISGSAGWEAMVKGKPAIIFGRPWYIGCEGCYNVSSVEECSKAFDEISKKSGDDILKDVLRYLCYFQNDFIISSNAYRFAQKSDIPYATLVENLASALIERVIRDKKKSNEKNNR